MAVLTSLSRDGAFQSSILKRLGFLVLRGSSSRGGAAGLKAMIGAIGNGADAAFAVDGPHGPYRRVKAGAIFAAEETGGQLLPITFRASSSWTFRKAWDKYQLPKPFARVELIRGEAIVPVRGELDCSRSALEKALLALDDCPPPHLQTDGRYGV